MSFRSNTTNIIYNITSYTIFFRKKNSNLNHVQTHKLINDESPRFSKFTKLLSIDSNNTSRTEIF